MSKNIDIWDVEDQNFFETKGKKIALRNLWISIPALLLGFAVWIMWGVITTYMKKYGYNFGLITPEMTPAEVSEKLKEINMLYYTLPAIAGLTGATLRIPNSFLISIAGGRNVIFITTFLLLLPVIGTGMALKNINTPYITFAILAALSGIGGGNFASSMSNISFFFPKKLQGTYLGMNAGIGNLGVGLMQKLIPISVGVYLFSAVDKSGNIVENTPIAGIQNAGWVWVIPVAAVSMAVLWGMNNLGSATPKIPSLLDGIFKTIYLMILGFISSGIGVFFLIKLKISMWLVLPFVIILTLLLMKFTTPQGVKANLNRQFSIFKLKHNWIMTIIYTMTFGSFIGFSAAFPKLCQDVFVYTNSSDQTFVNPNAPDYIFWVFLGPVLGAVIRPVGGWLSDKVNSGAKVTHISVILQIIATFLVAYFIKAAKASPTPENYWWPFFLMFMILFITTGIGNGSTFRSIPNIFEKSIAGPVLGWTSAIAAYGSFIIPGIFGEQIKAGTPEYAFYGLAGYYIVCLGLNWWYYLGPKAEIKNP